MRMTLTTEKKFLLARLKSKCMVIKYSQSIISFSYGYGEMWYFVCITRADVPM